MRTRPLLFTKIGAVLGLIAVLTWIATFSPRGGVELSGVLFPLWSLASRDIFSGRSVPVLMWYAGALLHWPVLGAVVDLLRAMRAQRLRADSPPTLPTNDDVPVSDGDLRALFDLLNEESGKGYRCDNEFTLTRQFLVTRQLPVEDTLRWLGENGAGCDCEVIFNVEAQWEERTGSAPKG